MKLRKPIGRFRIGEKGAGAEMRPAIVFGIVIGNLPVSYWPVFPLSLVTVPEVFTNVNWAQCPSRLLSVESLEQIPKTDTCEGNSTSRKEN